jgi:hypothetical protein
MRRGACSTRLFAKYWTSKTRLADPEVLGASSCQRHRRRSAAAGGLCTDLDGRPDDGAAGRCAGTLGRRRSLRRKGLRGPTRPHPCPNPRHAQTARYAYCAETRAARPIIGSSHRGRHCAAGAGVLLLIADRRGSTPRRLLDDALYHFLGAVAEFERDGEAHTRRIGQRNRCYKPS